MRNTATHMHWKMIRRLYRFEWFIDIFSTKCDDSISSIRLVLTLILKTKKLCYVLKMLGMVSIGQTRCVKNHFILKWFSVDQKNIWTWNFSWFLFSFPLHFYLFCTHYFKLFFAWFLRDFLRAFYNFFFKNDDVVFQKIFT